MSDENDFDDENPSPARRTFTVSCNEPCDCAENQCRHLDRLRGDAVEPLPAYEPNDFQRNTSVLIDVLDNLSFAFGELVRLNEEAFAPGEDA